MAAREKNFLLEVISRYHESGYLEGRKKILFCTNVHQNSSLQVPSLLHATTGKPAYTYLGSREFSTPPTLSRDTNSKLHKCFCWFVARDLNYSLLTSSINPLKGKKRLKVLKPEAVVSDRKFQTVLCLCRHKHLACGELSWCSKQSYRKD